MSSDYDHLVDALAYSYGWLRKSGQYEKQSMRRLPPHFDRENLGRWVPMRKETTVTTMWANKICFQLKDPRAVELVLRNRVISDCLEELHITKAFKDVRTFEVEFNKNATDNANQARILYQIIDSAGEWKVVGPRCLGRAFHSADDAHMEFTNSGKGQIWRCFQTECQETLKYYDCTHMAFSDFHALVHQGSLNAGTYKKHPYLPDTLIKDARKATKGIPTSLMTYNDSQQTVEVLTSNNKELLGRIQKLEMELERVTGISQTIDGTRQELDERSRQLSDAKIRIAVLEGLPNVADELFRFLAGINLQDHPLGEQKTFLKLMSKLKAELKKLGIGSKD